MRIFRQKRWLLLPGLLVLGAALQRDDQFPLQQTVIEGEQRGKHHENAGGRCDQEKELQQAEQAAQHAADQPQPAQRIEKLQNAAFLFSECLLLHQEASLCVRARAGIRCTKAGRAVRPPLR